MGDTVHPTDGLEARAMASRRDSTVVADQVDPTYAPLLPERQPLAALLRLSLLSEQRESLLRLSLLSKLFVHHVGELLLGHVVVRNWTISWCRCLRGILWALSGAPW